MSSLNIKRTLQYQKLDVNRQIDALKKKKKSKISTEANIYHTFKDNKKAEINQEY